MRKLWRHAIIPGWILFSISVQAQESSAQDMTLHSVQFVSVEKDVSLEVLDWGGSGYPVVMLAGLGASAHEFDKFAPLLSKHFHVYGITRRGFGASSKPASGYDFPRLVQDVTGVMDALKLKTPLVIGHSVAGQELNLLGAMHPQRIAGMVYLDATFDYTTKVPDEYLKLLVAVSPDSPGLRNKQGERPASLIGLRPSQQIIHSTSKPNYSSVKTPALAIIAVPRNPAGLFPDYESRDASTRAKINRMFTLNVKNVHHQKKMFADGVKRSTTLDIVGARHDIYRSNEDEVIKAIVDFAAKEGLR